MSVNSISSIYSSICRSLLSKAASSEDTSSTSSETSSITDILELCSSEEDLSTYLNYDSSGNYNTLSSTLLDYLNMDDDGTNLSGSSESLTDMLNSSNSEDTASNIFDCLINANAAKVEDLIEIAQEKLDADNTES